MKLEIGRRAYLWISAPKTFAQACVISTHGGETSGCFGNSFRVPPGTTLRFYSDHGHTVRDKGLHNFLDMDVGGRLRELASDDDDSGRVYGPGKLCPDYRLTKFQASEKPGASNTGRGKKETYGYIENFVTSDQRQQDTMHDLLAMSDMWKQSASGKSTSKSVEKVLLLDDTSDRSDAPVPAQYDIVTVRNRMVAMDMYLSELLDELKHVHVYKEVHCYFCRGSAA